MNLLLLLVRVALAGVFMTAGLAKFADLKGSEKAFKEFGMPASIALPSSIALSLAEVVIAVLFLFPQASWFAAIGASALLALFIAQMIYQRAKGNAPDCHCFGQLHSEPVSVKSIVRNAIFLVLAAVPVFRGPNGQGLSLEQVTAEMVPTILEGLAVVMLGGTLLYLRRLVSGQDEMRRRIDVLELIGREGTAVEHEHVSDPHLGLPIGAGLPDFEMPSLAGDMFSLKGLLATGKPTLFFFVAPTCEPCQALLSEFVEWRESLEDKISVRFITSGTVAENRKKFHELGQENVLIDDERKFAVSVGGRWTPTALFVNGSGKVASHVAAGDIAIEELVENILSTDTSKPYIFFANSDRHSRGLKIGKEIPEFRLTDIAGRNLTKKDLLGKRTLVTFWSPSCPHCTKILDDFRAWEAQKHNGDPDLLIFSDGDLDEHRLLGLKSPVVIDKGYKTAAKFGMFGTPSAVLVNEEGVIMTETGVGAPNIWALVGKRMNEAN